MKRFHFEFGLASLDTYFRNIVFAFRTMLMPGIPVTGSVRFETEPNQTEPNRIEIGSVQDF